MPLRDSSTRYNTSNIMTMRGGCIHHQHENAGSELLPKTKSYNRDRLQEDGGSADWEPDTSPHRCGLPLPSDINGPPFS
jgi:hypothetical protein